MILVSLISLAGMIVFGALAHMHHDPAQMTMAGGWVAVVSSIGALLALRSERSERRHVYSIRRLLRLSVRPVAVERIDAGLSERNDNRAQILIILAILGNSLQAFAEPALMLVDAVAAWLGVSA
ncbi:MAG: hypothetical protein HXY28_03000 [Hydrogenophilaceae bacterium]|nr:hypothetical protein [Hydrogenophilaceae bacterium]